MNNSGVIAFGRGAWRYALQTGAMLGNQQVPAETRLDADTINLERDFQARLPEIYRDRTPDLLSLKFVPISRAPLQMTDDSFIAQMLSMVGTAEVITSVSDDLPLVTMNGQTMTGRVVTLGAAGAWSFMDVFRASNSNSQVNLPMETVAATKRILEIRGDEILATGYPQAGIQGFLKLSGVTVVNFTLGAWNTRTFDQIVSDVMTFANACRARTNYVELARPDTMIFPSTLWAVMASKMNTFGQTALELVRAQLKSVYGIEIAEWSKANTANPGGGARVVCYRRDEMAVSAVVPTPFLALDVQAKGLQLLAPAISRIGGVFLVEPNTITYADNG